MASLSATSAGPANAIISDPADADAAHADDPQARPVVVAVPLEQMLGDERAKKSCAGGGREPGPSLTSETCSTGLLTVKQSITRTAFAKTWIGEA